METDEEWFLIENQHKGLVLDFLSRWGIVTNPKDGRDTQMWRWEDHALVSKDGGVLNAMKYYGTKDKGDVFVDEKDGSIDQKWRVEGEKIISYGNDLALDNNPNSDSFYPYVGLLAEEDGERKSQSWKFVPNSCNLTIGKYITSSTLVTISKYIIIKWPGNLIMLYYFYRISSFELKWKKTEKRNQ